MRQSKIVAEKALISLRQEMKFNLNSKVNIAFAISLAKTFISRVTISCLFLRFVLIFKGNVLENVNVLISKKRAYF